MTMKLSRLLLSTVLILVAFAGVFLVPPAPVSAAGPWYVATTGSDIAGTGTFANPWLTIQHAVIDGTVLSGDTINIAAGNYVEQVTVGKSLTLKGPSAPPYAVIVAPAVRVAISGYDYIVANNATDTLLLENLIINANNTSRMVGTRYAGVLLNADDAGSGIYNCSILGFNSADTTTEGVAIYGVSTLTIDNCDIRDFRGYGIYSNGIATNPTVSNCAIQCGLSAWGIRVVNGTAVVNGNTITGGAGGINSATTTNLAINDNEILNQLNYGIFCDTSTGAGPVTIVHNKIHGINTGTGFGIYNSGLVANGSIVNNTIYGCKTAINLNWAASTWSVTQNLIHHCTVSGVRFLGPISVFSQNAIFACVTGIDAQANWLTAHCNAILGNTTAGLTLAQNGTYDVTNNYWGRNSGPNVDGAGPGTGDKILSTPYTGLIYNPWLVISMSAAPATVVANGTSISTITFDCTKNSAGAATGCVIPVMANAVFTTNLGSFSGATTVTRPIVASLASAALASGTAGTATVTGYVAELWTVGLAELVTTPVVFTTPPPPPINPLLVNGAPTSHGSSAAGPAATTQPIFLPSIYAQSATLSAKTVTPGAPVTVTADIANKSAVNGNKKVTLYVNGQVETTRGVNVSSGSSTQLTFNVSRSEPGDYAVYVDGVPAGSFKVEMVSGNDAILILSAVLVGLAFIVGMVMLRRRQRTG